MSLTPENAPLQPAYIRDADGLYYAIGGGSRGMITLDRTSPVPPDTPAGTLILRTG